jgi:hypothetical protein
LFVRCSIFLLAVLCAAMPATARPTWSSEELFYSSRTVAAGTEQCSLAYYLSSANDSEISQLVGYLGNPDIPASDQTTVSAMLLPATPASGLLTLVGFICISLIQNRRIWLAGFAGLSLVSQTGKQAVVSSSRNDDSQARGNLFRSYPKGLTLPNTAGGVFAFSQKDIPRVNFTNTAFRTAAGSDYHWSYSAALNLVLHPVSSALCLVSGTRQSDCFQPVLIFCMMPRGPPISQMRPFSKTVTGV